MWILDSSIAIKWFFTDEIDWDLAQKVQNQLIAKPDQFMVPTLFFYEFTAVILRKSARDRLFAQKALNCLYQLGIPTAEIGEELSNIAIDLVCRYGLSFYDGIFVALAKSIKGAWLTSDQKALRKLPTSLTCHLSAF